ncbi:hypothetical protein Vretimale_10683 [Volvox reticuliferus]|uniref:Uncharacterized protein n=1 Tax=Volvox reticuliferus TaxID=1737510 RepID=A0A8J4GF13_9CHLO|nr:hypothetical protein Vretifemale_13915 [Volvox reticuliferus]GIM06352.1 hypothetical protein Vretimale_10683 [Volvox reticuliferus]
MEESLAGGKAYSRATVPEARVVRHGSKNASLGSGSWQSLAVDMAQPLMNGSGGHGNGAGKNIHATTNVVGGGGGGDVTAAASPPLTGITTPRRSVDTTTEGGSASGLASSSASGPVPMVLRRLRKTAFRKSGGGGSGGGGGGSGGSGTPGGAAILNAAVERKAAEQPGAPGKHRRAIRGLFGLGSWKGRFSHGGESVAAAAAAAATPQPPLTQHSLTEEHGNAHSLIHASGGSQNTEIKGFCATAATAAAAELTPDAVAATAVAANAAAAAAAASMAATGGSRGSFEGVPLEPRPFGSPFSAKTCSRPSTPGRAAAVGGAAAAKPKLNGVVAMVTPPPLLPPRPKRNLSPSPSRVDQDGTANAVSTAAACPTRTSVNTALRAAAAAAANTTATGAIYDGGCESVTLAAAAAAGGKEHSASGSEHPEQPHLMPPDVTELSEGLPQRTPPVTPPPPQQQRASIALSPLPDPDEGPPPQWRQLHHHHGQQQVEHQQGHGQAPGQGPLDIMGGGCAHQGQQQPDSPPQQQQQQRQESAGTAIPQAVDDPFRRLSIPLSAPTSMKEARISAPVAAATAAAAAAVDGGGSGDGGGDSAATLVAASGPSDPSFISTLMACSETAVASPPPVPQGGQQQQAQQQKDLEKHSQPQPQQQQQLLTLSSSRGSAFATPGAAAAAAAAAANGTSAISEALPYPPWSPTRTSTCGGGSSMGRQLQRELSAISTVSATAADSGIAAATGTAPLTVTSPVPNGVPSGASLPPWSSTLQSLSQVLKMQKSLQVERQARAELTEMLSEMTRKYEGMVRIRRFENYRALVEGARFQLHLANEVRRVVMWYNEARDVVQVDPDLGLGADRAQQRAGATELWPRSFAPQDMERADRGCFGFPTPSTWAGVMAVLMGRSRAPPAPEPMRCFSLYLGGGRCLHLQLPSSGNGRSRDEWLDALQDIAATGRSRVVREERASSTKTSKGLATGLQQAPGSTAAAPTAATATVAAASGNGATATSLTAAAVSGSTTPQLQNALPTAGAVGTAATTAAAMVATQTPQLPGSDGGCGPQAMNARPAE